MKVELDLSTEQLNQLDGDLTDLLKNLTEDQKIEIIKGYINYQFDKLTYKYTTSWGHGEELSQFGKDLVSGLQGQIVKSISDDIMENENLKKLIEDTITNVTKDLEQIIRGAISDYVVNNLFSSKEQIHDNIMQQIYNFDAMRRNQM